MRNQGECVLYVKAFKTVSKYSSIKHDEVMREGLRPLYFDRNHEEYRQDFFFQDVSNVR